MPTTGWSTVTVYSPLDAHSVWHTSSLTRRLYVVVAVKPDGGLYDADVAPLIFE